MPGENQANVGVKEPFNIIDAVNPALIAVGAQYPALLPFAFPLNYNDAFVNLPVSTIGWNEIFGYIASDQPMSISFYHFNDYNPATNQVLNRLHGSDRIIAWTDLILAGQYFADFTIPVVAPYLMFLVENTGANPMTFFSVHVGLRA